MNIKVPNKDLNRLSIKEYKQASKTPISLILDNVRSLNNIGSIFRTADAFLIEKIYLCGITAVPPHRDINKTALGATKSVAWQYVKDVHQLIHELKEQSINIFALEQTKNSIALSIFNALTYKSIAIILGNEVDGVQQSAINLCDGSIEIKQYGTKHSLNVSVSTGIVIWHLFQSFNKQ